MPNHVHLLLTPERDESVSRLMQSLGRRYVGYFNYNYARTGTLLRVAFGSVWFRTMNISSPARDLMVGRVGFEHQMNNTV
jgi:putative transposase